MRLLDREPTIHEWEASPEGLRDERHHIDAQGPFNTLPLHASALNSTSNLKAGTLTLMDTATVTYQAV
ncbi:MAG: hypothetical protein ACUVUB_07500 [Candidatus Bathyarchaeia archaeon]